MNIKMDEDPFGKNPKSICKIYHKVLVLKKILQTEPQVKKMNINYYDSNYTVIKKRDDWEIVDDKYEKD